MEFDELKKIWDSESNQTLFVINNEAMQKIVATKRDQSGRIANFTEWLMVSVNVMAAAVILVAVSRKDSINIFMILLMLWMLGSAAYVVIRRIVRIRGMRRFDRTMLGDLDYALELATYQVRLSALGRWNAIPVGVITVLALWQGGQSMVLAAGTVAFIALASWAAGWEHRIYKNRKRDLAQLKSKLVAGE